MSDGHQSIFNFFTLIPESTTPPALQTENGLAVTELKCPLWTEFLQRLSRGAPP